MLLGVAFFSAMILGEGVTSYKRRALWILMLFIWKLAVLADYSVNTFLRESEMEVPIIVTHNLLSGLIFLKELCGLLKLDATCRLQDELFCWKL